MLRSRRRARLEELEHEVVDPGEGPAGEVERRLEMERLMKAVSTLDAIPRAIVVLHYSEEMTCAEIGAVLEMTESAVKVALFRARERLRIKLGGPS
jgi:RNA polymerase sigma-70 factor (ECF subfamily)